MSDMSHLRPGIEHAAQYIEAQAAEYITENASTDPDTGAVIWHFGEAGCSYHSTLVELAEELRHLTAARSQ